MNAILLASNLAKNRLNEHLIEELKEKQDLLRLGQRRQEKPVEPVKAAQSS
jgi:hypothetical protein